MTGNGDGGARMPRAHAERKEKNGNKPLPTGVACDDCGAKCCRYFALEIDTPEDKDDFEDLRWYLCHENTVIYVDEGAWHVHVENDCRYRDQDHRCAIYERRPTMCREHSPDDCSYNDPWDYELKFSTLEELEIYIEAHFAG